MSRLPLVKSNVARVVERSPLDETLASDTPYLFQTVLSSFTRASAVAQNYRFYRCASVKFTYMPNVQSTIGGTGVTAGLKHIYYNMERQGWNAGVSSLDYFLDMGSKPIPFGSTTGKSVVIKYKPSLIQTMSSDPQSATTAGVINIQPVYNRWIATYVNNSGTPQLNNDIEWNGHSLWIDVTGATPVPNTGSYVVEAVWEFKDPYTPPTGGQGLQAELKK